MTNHFKEFNLTKFEETLEKIRPYILHTPVIRSYTLEELIPDKEIYLKLEFLQPTNSFKVRGAINKALSLGNNCLKKGLVTASGGNHGLGVCYAGKKLNSPVTVFLPESTPIEKINKIKKWNGEVRLYGEFWDESNSYAQEYAKEKGLTYVHPFDDPLIVLGQGTIALEFLSSVPDLDVIIASVGGGGLISGIGLAAKQINPKIKIWGVETIGADALTQSFYKGRPVTLPAITSIAVTLGAKRTTDDTFERFMAVVDKMKTVSDAQALKALKLLLDGEKILVEPAASCNVSAILEGRFDLSDIEKIGIVICGGNVSLQQLKDWHIFS